MKSKRESGTAVRGGSSISRGMGAVVGSAEGDMWPANESEPTVSSRVLAVATVLTLVLTACGSTPSEPNPPRQFTVDEQAVSRASTAFGLRLFGHVLTESTEANVLVSPLSVSMALGMTANGAAGQTLAEMRTVLGFAGVQESDVNEAYRGLIEQLRARDPGVEFRLANSVWYERSFQVEVPFLDAARTYFDAEVRPLDFADPGAPATISRWAEDATGGRIKDLIRSISPNEIMFLVNAVYFKAPWTTPFNPDATRDAAFTRPDGSIVQAPMMTVDASRPFLSDANVQIVELLYADSAFSMVVVAPAQGKTMADLVASLSEEQWADWMTSLTNGRMYLTMPKFRFDFGKRLNDALKTMGMGTAFIPFAADFSRITTSRNDVYISRVEHKTFIDVHELGTEAAAATAVGISVTSLPPSITFDRPFLFAIRERSSGTLLFIGRVGDPNAH